MKFSIVTPSFRNSAWLKLCIASVADQQGVEFEHIVQDSCSEDGTQDWLSGDARVRAFIEKDAGMYDAVNRGFRRATGDIVAYLNCDEQYLPDALRAVQEKFTAQPELDAVVSDTVVTDPEGGYVCHRYGIPPQKHAVWVRFDVLTCALFIHRRVLDTHGLFFDTKWRDLGDMFWLIAATEGSLRFGKLRRLTSVFTETGENMNLKPNALREKELRAQMTPAWVRTMAPLLRFHQRARLFRSGAFSQQPFDYALYTQACPDRRVTRQAAVPVARWPGRR